MSHPTDEAQKVAHAALTLMRLFARLYPERGADVLRLADELEKIADGEG